MFEHLTLTLAQEDAPPSLPSAPATTPGGSGQAPLTQQPDAAPLPPDPGAGQGGMPPIFFIIFAALIVMIIFSMGSQRKEKKKREQLLANLHKGDRVQTIGGVLGNVVEVRDEYVVVKIDENTNTRVKFSRSAIQSVTQEKDE